MKTNRHFIFARGNHSLAIATAIHTSNSGTHNLMFKSVPLSVFPIS
jgi:hypothetical protein